MRKFGIQKGKKEQSIEIAKKLLSKGVDIKEIAEITRAYRRRNKENIN